jgi:hypothetical protein
MTPYMDFQIQEGFFFKHRKLCIPWSYLRLNLIQELNSGGLGGNFRVDKTKELVDEGYFWSSVNKYVNIFVECCRIFFNWPRGESITLGYILLYLYLKKA